MNRFREIWETLREGREGIDTFIDRYLWLKIGLGAIIASLFIVPLMFVWAHNSRFPFVHLIIFSVLVMLLYSAWAIVVTVVHIREYGYSSR